MKLPQIYTHFKQGQVFTIDEARRKLCTNGNTLRKRLSDLSMRGYISPIRQGMYRLSKFGESRFEKHVCSPYEIASKLTPYCYLGYKTALQFHAKKQIPENNKVYIISATKFNGFKFDTRTYIWCQSSEFYGIESHILHEDNHEFILHTTNIEKTLIDCLKRPAHCPNFDELIKLSSQIPITPDIEKLIYYAEKIEIRSVFNRLGYLLESKQKNWSIPNTILSNLENKMNQKITDWPIINTKYNSNRWKINFLNSNYISNSQLFL